MTGRKGTSASVLVLAVSLGIFSRPLPVAGQLPAAPLPVLIGPGQAAPPLGGPLVVGLPVPHMGAAGELVVQPNVLANGFPLTPSGGPMLTPLGGGAGWPVQQVAAEQGAEPLPAPSILPSWLGGSGEGQGPGLGLFRGDPTDLVWGSSDPLIPWDDFHAWAERPVSPTGEPGIGRERVMYAPFEIDITQPFGNFLLRTDSVYHLTKPDRAEFFWARPGRGPALPEKSVDYQDFRFRWEAGNDVVSVATDVPVVLLNPEVNGNNGGIGDIQLVEKTLLMNGSRWQMTQLLRTVFNSGNARKGLGTGHVAMEPGLLCRYKQDELTFWHGEVKMMFPIAGDPIYSGPALTWGIGVSHLWYETDTTAYIPTLEFTNIWLLDGQFTPFPGGKPVDIDGDGIFNLSPGLRIVTDTQGDLGVVEFGINGVFAVGSNGWYDALIRFDMRFVF